VANQLQHSPADVTAQLLRNLGLGVLGSYDSSGNYNGAAWPVQSFGEPEQPDEVITVYDTAGVEEGRTMTDGQIQEHRGVQVRVRSKTFPGGWLKADSIRQALAQTVKLTQVTLEGVNYLVGCFGKIGTIMVLGKDSPDTKRSLFTVNATVALAMYPLN
jgi:hypothetical protein